MNIIKRSSEKEKLCIFLSETKLKEAHKRFEFYISPNIIYYDTNLNAYVMHREFERG